MARIPRSFARRARSMASIFLATPSGSACACISIAPLRVCALADSETTRNIAASCDLMDAPFIEQVSLELGVDLTKLFPGHGSVRRLDIGRETILAAPARIFGHSRVLLDVVERLARLHHRTDPIEQQLIIGFAVLEDLHRAWRAVPRNDVLGVQRLHHLACGKDI